MAWEYIIALVLIGLYVSWIMTPVVIWLAEGEDN